jgi:hypothetical protein
MVHSRRFPSIMSSKGDTSEHERVLSRLHHEFFVTFNR